jgi:hypothetical protein
MNDTKEDLIAQGWKITSDGPSGTQLEEPKRMNKREGFAVVAGIALLPAYGFGLIIILAAFVDHVTRKPNVRFFSR